MNGIIFDLDGVIVNTAKYHYLGWKRLADEMGVPFNEEKNEKLKGVNRRDSLIALLGYTPEEQKIQEWCDLKNKYYLEYIEQISDSDLIPGAISLLQEIKSNSSWKQALASSSKNAKTVIQKLSLEQYFDAIVDGHEVEKAKPDPEIFLKAAHKLDLHPDHIIVIEDAEAGIISAKAAGMLAIGIGENDILYKADLVITDLTEITLDSLEKFFE